MRKFQKFKRIAALLLVSSLMMSLALVACGDANPTNATNTTQPVRGTAPVTPLSPHVFSVVTTDVASSGTGTTTTISTTEGQTPKLATDTPSSTPPGSIRNNWLRGVPCKAPCWENITPGKTTPEEAQTLLKQNPSIGDFEVDDPQFGTKPAVIYLSLADNITDLGFITFHSEPKPAKIETIKLEVESFQPRDVFTLYGEPSHVSVIEKTNELGHGTGEYKTYLVYLNLGLILSSIYSKETALTPETVFNEVYFFIPGQAGLDILDTQKELKEKLLVGWEGFKDAKYYCRYQVQTGIKTC